MSGAIRINAAQELYSALQELKKINPERKIIIIGFSHGGNIALSLQQINMKENNPSFHIDLLILLATPIGKISEINANTNFFSQIINFYSLQDYYQISDLFFNFPYTKRFFNNNKNVINIDVRYYKKKNNKIEVIYPGHRHFGYITVTNELPSFLTILPDILNKIKKNYEIKNRNNIIITINLERNFKIKIKKK